MLLELTGFFPVPDRADAALRTLQSAGFDVSTASLVTGEDAKSALHRRLAAARRGRAAIGAAVCGGLAFLLAAIIFLPTRGAEGSYPALFLLGLVGFSTLIGAAIGAYYGMGVEKESVLVGVLVARERIAEAKRILQGTGARFIGARPVYDL